ncbi:MAG: hypothetical protein WBA31_05435 [Candidatus Dormiibacterota bacterium]
MDDAEGAPRGFVARVEDELRADVAADESLAKSLVAELLEKVEALEKRIAHLERNA